MKKVLVTMVIGLAVMFGLQAPSYGITRECAAASGRLTLAQNQLAALILGHPTLYALYLTTGIDMAGFGAAYDRVTSADWSEIDQCGG
jgi:hypothetical protein